MVATLGEMIKHCKAAYPFNIYCDDVDLCVFKQECDDARAKDHGRSIRALVHCCEFSSDLYTLLYMTEV